ncbi:MAG: CoA transferase [Chloroflexi bacterium]|nr:CoA transferase [Chloroflexota bacterium]
MESIGRSQQLPFAGIRVLDMSQGWAGPLCGMLLADMGAEVITLEAVQRVDWWRGVYHRPGTREDHGWEKSSHFVPVNRNKLDLTLDLTRPRGRGLVKELIRLSDVLIENFTIRVMKNFGLEYRDVSALKPDLIMVSLPGFGMSGPWKDYAAYGQTTESMAGLVALCGYEGGSPTLQSISYGDPVAGLNAATAVMMALFHRRRTGQGQHIEVAQVEALIPHLGGPIMDWFLNRRIWPRIGNRSRWMVPHGCYPAAGHDQWVVLGVASDAEWRALCEALGQPELAEDPRFTIPSQRRRHHDALDAIIAEWTCGLDKHEVARRLQAAGVAAGAVQDAPDLLADPQLAAREFFFEIERRYVGRHRYPGPTARLSRTPAQVRQPAPLLGEHNELVLRDLLGLSESEIEELKRDRIIGDELLI